MLDNILKKIAISTVILSNSGCISQYYKDNFSTPDAGNTQISSFDANQDRHDAGILVEDYSIPLVVNIGEEYKVLIRYDRKDKSDQKRTIEISIGVPGKYNLTYLDSNKDGNLDSEEFQYINDKGEWEGFTTYLPEFSPEKIIEMNCKTIEHINEKARCSKPQNTGIKKAPSGEGINVLE